jgi:hypothetical protein
MASDVGEPKTPVVRVTVDTSIPMVLQARPIRVIAISPPPSSPPMPSVPRAQQQARAPRSRSRRTTRNHGPPRSTGTDDDPDPDDVTAEVERLRERCAAALDAGNDDLAIRLYAKAIVTHFACLWERA